MKLIDGMALQKCHRMSKLQKKKFDKKLAHLAAMHKRKMQTLETRHREEKRLWKNKVEHQLTAANASSDHELSRLRRQYQLHMEQLRAIYHQQHATFVAEMKNTLDSQIEYSTANYESLAAEIQRQLATFQKWMQEELVEHVLLKKSAKVESEIEQIRSALELKINELIEYLNERDTEIEESKERLGELEDRLAQTRPRTIWAKMKREPQSEPQKFRHENGPTHDDILKIIKEIAHERART